MIPFVDSAYAPTVGQVRYAVTQGIEAWAFYLAGPGALHNWSAAEVDVLRQGGILQGLPIYVPRLDLTTDPATDAHDFAGVMATCGVYNVGVLDTEASMRGNANLKTYVNTFVWELHALGITPVVYGGGDYVPAGIDAWWIKPGQPPSGQAFQYGSGSLDGISVDHDNAASAGFPFATLITPTPTPIPTPTPTPIPIEVPEMFIDTQDNELWLCTPGIAMHILTPADATNYEAIGIKALPTPQSAAQWALYAKIGV